MTPLDNPDNPRNRQVGGSHYKGMAIQPVEFCQLNQLPYLESSVIRYVTRHRRKNGAEDLRKAIHCLELLLELEYPPGSTPPSRGPLEEMHNEIQKALAAEEAARAARQADFPQMQSQAAAAGCPACNTGTRHCPGCVGLGDHIPECSAAAPTQPHRNA